MSQIPVINLSNQKKFPIVGLGTFKIKGQEDTYNILDNALKLGYRLFDTAQIYKNETFIGKALRELLPKYNLKREDIFITTKIATHNHGAEKCRQSILESLKSLQTDYIDLMLIHWPGVKGLKLDDIKNAEMRKETWLELERLYKEESSCLKAIGVSNYNLAHMQELLSYTCTKPHVLQSECHPLLAQLELREFCASHDIVFQAYSSLGTSDSSQASKLTENEQVVAVSKNYPSKTTAQILLKWAVQQNIPVIPKASSFEHLSENVHLFDFEIEANDMKLLSNIDCNSGAHLCWNPDTVK